MSRISVRTSRFIWDNLASLDAYSSILLVTIMVVTLTACAKSEPKRCGVNDQEWATHRALWQSKGTLDYDMIVERFNNPMYGHVPFLIKVRGGKNVSMEPARENRGLELTDGYEAVSTIERMFEIVRQACENGNLATVEYDKLNGVPTYIGISRNSDPADKADGYMVERLDVITK